MNHYELCFKAYCGEAGKRKHHLTDYCKEGYTTDSKTDQRISYERCEDWLPRCSELKPPRRHRWEPKVVFEPKRGKLI